MRYQSALVLSTLAVGQAAAGNLRHASFHARRNAEDKRDMADVNWNTVAYDLSNVDWKTVDYHMGQGQATSTPAAAAAPAAQTSAPAQAPAPAPAPAPAQAEGVTPTSSGGSADVGDFDLVKKYGVAKGVNAASSNGAIWQGDDSNYKATFTNDGNSPIAILCWGAKGMWINASPPEIFVAVAGGESTTVSIAQGYSGGCGAATTTSDLMMGLLNESILEFTANDGALGCFDVSREINMNGLVLSAKGSKCTSGVSAGAASCVFGCVGGLTSCGKGKAQTGTGSADFNIALGSAASGNCMIGTDPYTGDPSGGCQFGTGEHVQVTVFSNRDWPSVSF